MNTLKKIFIVIIINCSIITAHGQYASLSTNSSDIMNAKKSIDIDYSDWSDLLRNNTSIFGAIDYTGFKANSNEFNSFLKKLSNTKITKSWDENDLKAYWMNAYNAFAIKLISNNFPARSMDDIEKPYKTAFFYMDGKMMCLNDIEDKIKALKDPRMLLLLNKGTLSSAKLVKLAYTAENVEELLEKRVRIFINNNSKNKINAFGYKLSELFYTYKKEFKESNSGSVINFINAYSDIEIHNQSNDGYIKNDNTINSYQEVLN